MNLTSSSRMKEIDRISIEEKGFGSLLLMENAGIRILQETEAHVDIDSGKKIVCAAGHGNNGGDALVIARQIFSRKECDVTVLIYSDHGSAAYEFNLNLCRNLGVRVINFSSETMEAVRKIFEQADVIFDGLSGTGIRGELHSPVKEIVLIINESSAVKVSIDIPSGTGEGFNKNNTAVKADYTMTVGLPKRSLYLPSARAFCGRIVTVAIGFPEELKNDESLEPDGRSWKLYSEDDISTLMPELKPGDYKNSRGHAGVFAGSPGTTGAAFLCAEAALRSPAGMVSLFADEDIYPILAPQARAVMVKLLKNVRSSEADNQIPDLSKFQALAVGPGWGRAGRDTMLQELLESGPGVLDADGINVLAEIVNGGKSGKDSKGIKDSRSYPDLGRRWILTPHAGEFRRLFADLKPLEQPFTAVPAAAERLNAVIVLKGAVTFIASPDGRFAVIDGVFPELGTAGSGDILSGLTAGYLAYMRDPFEAAVTAVLVHRRAGVRCGCQHQWFSAEDLINYL